MKINDLAYEVKNIIKESESNNGCWFFDLKVNKEGILFRFLEICVNFRSKILRTPYGDQGLLISKRMYQYIGGYSPLHLMEDLEIILRLSKRMNLKCLDMPLYTDSRKWDGVGLIQQSWKNALLRLRWRLGESTTKLSQKYYSKR